MTGRGKSDRACATLRSDSDARTEVIAAALAGQLRAGDVVALEGALGAGKTCFVRGLAAGLGIDSRQVSSPTFVICHEYAVGGDEGAAALSVIHIDAYRLSGEAELETIGFGELLERDDAIIAIEWAGKIAAALPANRIEVELRHEGERQRSVTVSAPVARADLVERVKRSIEVAPVETVRRAACRTCGTSFDPTLSTYPFCSERCRMADLGGWFSERYRTSRDVEEDDELE